MPAADINPGHYSGIVNAICADLAGGPDPRLSISGVHERLQELAKAEPPDPTLRALSDACAYHFVDEGAESPFAVGCYEPMVVLPKDGGLVSYPTPLDCVEGAVMDAWGECARDESLHPLVRARLADLLWTRRHDGKGRWFIVAGASYLGSAEVVERVSGLCRAVAVCKESNHRNLMSGPLEALRHLARESLDAGRDEYGVVARALQSLADNDYPCSDLIEDSIAKYSDDPFRASQLLEIAARASQDDNEKKRLQHERVRVFEKAADRSSGLLRVSYLEEARTIARDAGLAEEVRRLTTLIERTDTDRDMHTFTQNIEIDPDELRSWVDAVVGEDSLLDALLRLGATTPIGDPESTRATVDEIASKLLFRSLMTTLQFGPENSMIRVPPGDPLHSEIDRGRYDALAIEMFASTCGKMVLDSLHDKYSPQEQDLAGCFACDAVPPEIARRIAVSYGRWADTDYTSAVSVIALTLELIVRRVCRQAGIHVTTTRRSNPPIPEVRPLGELIRELEPLIGRTATRYLEASLVDPWSLNLRNRLAHVLVEELTETHYLVLLHLACALRYIAEALPAEGT